MKHKDSFEQAMEQIESLVEAINSLTVVLDSCARQLSHLVDAANAEAHAHKENRGV